jgi:alpha-L-rhamnosidase
VRIRPHLGRLEWARAKMPHPSGTIAVDLRKNPAGLAGSITLPPGLRGTFHDSARITELAPGRNAVGGGR